MRSCAIRSVVVGSLVLLASSGDLSAQAFPAPTKLWAAQISPTDIMLVWSRVPGAVRYRIHSLSGASPTVLGEPRASAESYVVRVTSYGSPQQYAIEAVSENGSVSARAAFNVVTPVQSPAGTATAPSSVNARADAGTIAVTWDPVPDATAYVISRSVAPAGFRVLCRVCPTTTTFVDSTVVAGAKHVYTVAALTAHGPSRQTKSGEATPSAGAAASVASGANAPNVPAAGADAPKGTLHLSPQRSCLSIGQEGDFLVRMGDGTVRMYERVEFRPRGMHVAESPALAPVAGISDAVDVATSGAHSLVLRSDGTILSWGLNGRGELGSEAGINRRFGTPTPIPVASPSPVRDIGNAIGIAVGHDHSAALLADGTIRTWGVAWHGVPGDGVMQLSGSHIYDHLAPTPVTGISSATAIATSDASTFALLADGSVRAWGGNLMIGGEHGVLGTGSDEDTATPLPVVGITNAVAIAAGSGAGAALLSNGTVQAWGYGYGEGRGHGRGRRSTNAPAPVVGIRDAIAISPFMALLRDGTVREFPDGAWPWTTPKLANVVAVASDRTNRLALLTDGRLVAWGLKQFYPRGLVTLGELGAATARQCVTNGR